MNPGDSVKSIKHILASKIREKTPKRQLLRFERLATLAETGDDEFISCLGIF